MALVTVSRGIGRARVLVGDPAAAREGFIRVAAARDMYLAMPSFRNLSVSFTPGQGAQGEILEA
jgi:hypothetical protein